MSPRRVVAATPGGSITPDMIVGYVAWFTLPDEDVPLSRLRAAWASNGLDPQTLPKGARPVHVFQRACRGIETRRRNGRDVEIKVDEVEDTYDACIYQITKLVRDHEERVIEHPKAMRVTFNKARIGTDDELTFDVLEGAQRREVVPMFEQIAEFFEKNSTRLPGHKIRALVRRMLTHDLHGENLKGKSGGVYFIPPAGKDTLDGLGEALSDLFKGNAFMHTLPLVNDQTQREMLRERHVANAMDEIDEILQRTTRLVRSNDTRSRNVRSNVMEKLWAEHRRIRERASQYAQLLEEESEDVNEKLSVLAEQIGKVEQAAGV